MGIRTTVTLDEDVLERVKQESRKRGIPFRQALNDMLRTALTAQPQPPKRSFEVIPFENGLRTDINYDCTAALLDYLEGPEHR